MQARDHVLMHCIVVKKMAFYLCLYVRSCWNTLFPAPRNTECSTKHVYPAVHGRIEWLLPHSQAHLLAIVRGV